MCHHELHVQSLTYTYPPSVVGTHQVSPLDLGDGLDEVLPLVREEK